jgi:hypothetical protein
MGDERKLCKILRGKAEGKRHLERPRHRREVGIRMDIRNMARRMLSGFNWPRIGASGGLL